MRNVEIIELRALHRRVRSELAGELALAAGQAIEIGAHADDLEGVIDHARPIEPFHELRLHANGADLVIDVGG